MFLFELAMQLDVRSADMADAAPGLGLDGLTPTSELTAEQEQVLRARFTKAPAVAPAGGTPGGPPGGLPFTPPGSQPLGGGAAAPASPPDWGPPPSGGNRGASFPQMAMIAFAVMGVIGLFAFMATKGGPDEERLERIAATNPSDEDEAPAGRELTDKERLYLAKVDAAKKAEADRDAPRDLARFCKAGEAWHAFDKALTTNFRRGDLQDAQALIGNGYDLALADMAEMEATIGLDHITLAQQAQAQERQLLDLFRTGSIDDLRARMPEIEAAAAPSYTLDLTMIVYEHCVAPES